MHPSPPAAHPAAPSVALAAARERVVRLLTDRYADDSLTVEEFEARLDRLHATTDLAQLDAMAGELAAPRQANPPAPAPASPYPAVPLPDDPARRALVVMGERRYRGRVSIPARWEIGAVMGGVTIDLREAEFPAGHCHLDLFAVLSGVEILVPAHLAVELDLSPILAGAEGPEHAPAGGIPLRIGGTLVLSGVEVRVAPPELPSDLPFAKAWKAAKRRRGAR